MGVREEVTWKMSADTAEVVRAWQQMAQGQQKVIDQLDKMGKAGAKSGNEMGSAIGSAIGKYASVAGAINLASRALSFYIDVNQRFIQQSSQTTLALDESFRAVRLVGKLFDDNAARQAELAIQGIANKRKVSFEQANASAFQLASGGLPMDEIIQGGGLDEFLKMAKTTSAAGAGADMKATARAATMFLSGTGQKPDAAGLHNLGRSMSGLFETNVELSDLEELAAVGKGIKEMGGQAKPEDMLAMFSILRDTIPAAESATHFRNSILNLATAGDDPKSKAALQRMGLKPSDVDFVGEDISQVFTTLGQGVGRLKPEERTIMLNRIFGQRNIVGAQAMMEGVGKMPERLAMAGNEESYARAVKLATEGPSGERTVAENQEKASLQGTGAEAFVTEEIQRRTAFRKEGISEFENALNEKLRAFGKFMFNSPDAFSLISDNPAARGAPAPSDGGKPWSGPIQIQLIDADGGRQRATMKPAESLSSQTQW